MCRGLTSDDDEVLRILLTPMRVEDGRRIVMRSKRPVRNAGRSGATNPGNYVTMSMPRLAFLPR